MTPVAGNPKTGASGSSTIRAAIWMTGAIGSFSAMAVAGRELSSALDTFELMMYRSLVGIVIVLIVAARARTLSQITFARFNLHLFRNLAHFAGQNLWFYALPLIPLAQVFALEFTTPLWVLLLAPFFLGEKLTRLRAMAAALGFSGILLVARPDVGGINAGVLSVTLAAVGFAATTILTKRLTRTDSITTILFFLTTMQAVFGIVTAGYDGRIALPDVQTAPWILIVGFAGLLAHFCITNALRIAPAVVVIPFDFARLPVIAIIGVLFYGEALDLLAFVGALVIFGANYMTIRAETKSVPVRPPL